jgi:DinB superfamily
MLRSVIQQALHQKHLDLIAFIKSLTTDEFSTVRHSKWTPGQQLDHIYRSIRPLRIVLSAPRVLLQLLWGTANRKSRTYDELVELYQAKLTSGGRATGRFIPAAISGTRQLDIAAKLERESVRLVNALGRFTDEELDKYLLPHPLLGKLSIREMMYFTIYHAGHHLQLTKRDLA